MSLIQHEELLTFYNENNNRILNKNNIELKLRLPGRIIAGYQLEIEQKEKYSIILQTEYKFLMKLIIDNQVQSLEDLQCLSESDLWQRYLSGKGEVVAVIHETKAKLFFTTTSSGRTSISAEYSRFRAFVNSAFSLPEQFEEYIMANWCELTTPVINRRMTGNGKLSNTSID